MPLFLDSLFICIVIIFGYNGFTKGFIEELGRLLGLIIAVLIAMSRGPEFAFELNHILKLDNRFILFFSYTFLFFIVLLFFRILTKFVNIAFLSRENHFTNHTLGFIFGLFKGIVVLISFVWFISILPLQKWTNIINDNSRFAYYSNNIRIGIVSFFNWEDPISLSESYIKNLTQP